MGCDSLASNSGKEEYDELAPSQDGSEPGCCQSNPSIPLCWLLDLSHEESRMLTERTRFVCEIVGRNTALGQLNVM